MSFQDSITGFLPPVGETTAHGARGGVATLSGRTGGRSGTTEQGRPDGRAARPRLSPQDLVGLLFRQRARARNAALPRVRVSVSVFAPSGRPAVQISL